MWHQGPQCKKCSKGINEGETFIRADHGHGKQSYCQPCNRKLIDADQDKDTVIDDKPSDKKMGFSGHPRSGGKKDLNEG